jgi:hypothetical protein
MLKTNITISKHKDYLFLLGISDVMNYLLMLMINARRNVDKMG